MYVETIANTFIRIHNINAVDNDVWFFSKKIASGWEPPRLVTNYVSTFNSLSKLNRCALGDIHELYWV